MLWCYDELGDDNPKIISEEEILETYYEFWKGKMIKKYGENSHLITNHNCIEDWVTIHWAWRFVTDE